MLQRVAIELHGMICVGERHGKLIHDAALHTDEISFCGLCHMDQLHQWQVCA